MQDYLKKTAHDIKGGAKITAKLIKREKHEQADGMAYDIDIEVVPTGKNPKHS
jgi:hypothetical protein